MSGTMTEIMKTSEQMVAETGSWHLSIWLECAERTKERLDKITQASPSHFLNGICKKFIQDTDKDNIHLYAVQLAKLQKAIYRYQGEVLQLDGLGDVWKRVEEISKEICLIV